MLTGYGDPTVPFKLEAARVYAANFIYVRSAEPSNCVCVREEYADSATVETGKAKTNANPAHTRLRTNFLLVTGYSR